MAEQNRGEDCPVWDDRTAVESIEEAILKGWRWCPQCGDWSSFDKGSKFYKDQCSWCDQKLIQPQELLSLADGYEREGHRHADNLAAA